MQVSCNYRLFLAMKPDLVGFQILISYPIFFFRKCSLQNCYVAHILYLLRLCEASTFNPLNTELNPICQ